MESRVGDVVVHYVQHGEGVPVLVLHGAGVDHREVEACFEPALRAVGGHRRIYPDLPGMGQTRAPAALRSADDVLDVLLGSHTSSRSCWPPCSPTGSPGLLTNDGAPHANW